MSKKVNAIEYVFQNNLTNWGIPVAVSNGIISKIFNITDTNIIDEANLEKYATNAITDLIGSGGTTRPKFMDKISEGIGGTKLAELGSDAVSIYNMNFIGIGFRPGFSGKDLQQKFYNAISGTDSEIKDIAGYRSLMTDGLNTTRKLFEGHIDIEKQCEEAANIAAKGSLPNQCWLCGGKMTDKGGKGGLTTRVCEHVLPVTVASMANMLITGHDSRALVYGAEYKWSHDCCNGIKSDKLPVSTILGGKNGIKMVINDSELTNLVNIITNGCRSKILGNFGRECNNAKLTEVLQPAIDNFNIYLDSKAVTDTSDNKRLITKLEVLFDVVLRPFVVGMNVLKSNCPFFRNLSYEQIYDQINGANIEQLFRIIHSVDNKTINDHILLSIIYLLLIQGKPIDSILHIHYNLCNRLRLIRAGTVFIIDCVKKNKKSLITPQLKELMFSHFEGTINFANGIKGKALSSADWKRLDADTQFNERLRLEIINVYGELAPAFTGEENKKLVELIQTINAPSDDKPVKTKPKGVKRKPEIQLQSPRRSKRLQAKKSARGGKTPSRTPKRRKRTSSKSKKTRKLLNLNNKGKINYELNNKISFNEFMLRQTVFMSLLSLSYSMKDTDITAIRKQLGLEFIGLGSRRVTAPFGGGNSTDNKLITPSSLTRSISPLSPPVPSVSRSSIKSLSPSLSKSPSLSMSPSLSRSRIKTPSSIRRKTVKANTPSRSLRRTGRSIKQPSLRKTRQRRVLPNNPMRNTRRRMPKPLVLNNYKEAAFNFGFGQFILLKKAYEEVNKNYNKPNLNTGKNIAKQLKIAFECSKEFDKAVA